MSPYRYFTLQFLANSGSWLYYSRNLDAKLRKLNIDGLLPGTKYKFRIMATNDVADSPYSNSSQEVTTNPTSKTIDTFCREHAIFLIARRCTGLFKIRAHLDLPCLEEVSLYVLFPLTRIKRNLCQVVLKIGKHLSKSVDWKLSRSFGVMASDNACSTENQTRPGRAKFRFRNVC